MSIPATVVDTHNATPTYDPKEIEQCLTMQKEEFEVLEVGFTGQQLVGDADSLQSIYPEYVSSQNLNGDLKLEIPVELGSFRSVIISEPRSLSTIPERKPTVQSVSLSTLPPLLIHMILPPSYPIHDPPRIVSTRATHLWLPEIGLLQATLLELWHPGESALYDWVEYIRTGEFLEKLKLLSPTHKDIIMLPHPAPQMIAPLLKIYDETSRSNEFSKNSYPCSVCLDWLKGSKCLQLLCKHIFCRECLEDFWKLCIEEGDVGRVGCPDPECIKKGSEADEEEVARVVTDAELERWKWLREKRNYDRDPTIVHCPVSVCQAPVPKPSDVDAESGWNRLRQCPRCMFTFCAFCKRTWHGTLDKCPIAQYEDLALEYINAEENSPTRARLERKYGKANIRRLIATYQEEKANMQWLSSSTMQCPGCRCYVEKNMGCNHMTCSKCNQHFCYKCGDRLNGASPYAHFSNAATPCFNQLFDIVDVDPEDWEPMD